MIAKITGGYVKQPSATGSGIEACTDQCFARGAFSEVCFLGGDLNSVKQCECFIIEVCVQFQGSLTSNEHQGDGNLTFLFPKMLNSTGVAHSTLR